VDAVSITKFERIGENNLYKLWNRMSAGRYMPGLVRGVEIPKDHVKESVCSVCSTHYIERWLKAPMQMPDGCLVAREKGPYRRTPLQDLELMVEHDDLDVFLEPTETMNSQEVEGATEETKEENETATTREADAGIGPGQAGVRVCAPHNLGCHSALP
jgi:hypothetical protein